MQRDPQLPHWDETRLSLPFQQQRRAVDVVSCSIAMKLGGAVPATVMSVRQMCQARDTIKQEPQIVRPFSIKVPPCES
jgi:hypothetical protein